MGFILVVLHWKEMLKKLLPSSDLFKNISTLVAGTFAAQLIAILMQGVLRRLYPVEDFGVYDVFISITGILMVIASLRYEMAVVLPEKKEDAVNLVFAGLFSSFTFNFVLLLLLYFFEGPILRFLNLESQHRFMLYYLPAAILLFSTYQVFNYYLVRYKAYKDISVNRISRRISEGAGQAVFALAGRLHTGLIWGNIIGHVVNIVAGWIQMLRNGFSLKSFSIRRQWTLAGRYKEFPVYNMFPALLNAICMHLPLLLINKFYDPEATAHFGLARNVLVLPASILTVSISQVLLQSISEKCRAKESFISDLNRILVLLGVLAAVMTVLILLWGPNLFALYAGQEYYISGIYARIIVAGAALKLVVAPVSTLVIPLNKIKVFSLWQVVYFLLISSLFLMSHLHIHTFLYVILIMDVIAYSALLAIILYLSHSYEKSINQQHH